MSELWSLFGVEFGDFFDTQRRSIPKAYAFGNNIRALSKKGIAAVIFRDEQVPLIKEEMFSYWSQMTQLHLPESFAATQQFETAQEMVEFLAVDQMFSAILAGKGSDSFDWDDVIHWEEIGPEKIGVTPQAWLCGLIDAGSELSRVINRYIILNKPSRNQRRHLREGFLEVARRLNNFLDVFSEVTPAVMDAYNKYGFRQSFRSKLNQLRGAIEYQERFVLEAIEHED